MWKRVGREPSGNPFNSIVQLEHEHGIPRNPFINAGAIVVSDVLLAGHQPREAIGEILRFIQFLADDDTIIIDRDVAASERATGFRNFALANYMRSFGNLDHAAELALGVYFHHCAIAMSCRQLALAGRFLAYGGRNPATGHSVVSAERARRINALMLTCGHYDGSGDFAFRVGIPGKSGVGGGILAIVPGMASLAVWSPGLNANGNSMLGSIALERLAKIMNWSVFRSRIKIWGRHRDWGASDKKIPRCRQDSAGFFWSKDQAKLRKSLEKAFPLPPAGTLRLLFGLFLFGNSRGHDRLNRSIDRYGLASRWADLRFLRRRRPRLFPLETGAGSLGRNFRLGYRRLGNDVRRSLLRLGGAARLLRLFGAWHVVIGRSKVHRLFDRRCFDRRCRCRFAGDGLQDLGTVSRLGSACIDLAFAVFTAIALAAALAAPTLLAQTFIRPPSHSGFLGRHPTLPPPR